MRHPWRYSKFYQVGHLSPPFHSLLGNECYLPYTMDLSGSVFQLQYLNPNYEIPSFVFCVGTTDFVLSSSSENLPFFYFLGSKSWGVGFEMCISVSTVTAGARRMRVVSAHKQLVVLLLFTPFFLCLFCMHDFGSCLL